MQASDTFSFGVLLWLMHTGEHRWQSFCIDQVLMQQMWGLCSAPAGSIQPVGERPWQAETATEMINLVSSGEAKLPFEDAPESFEAS